MANRPSPRSTTPRDPPKCRGLNFPGPATLFSQSVVQRWQTWGSRSWLAGWAGRLLRSARWGPDGCRHELSLQIKSVGRRGTSIGDLPRAIFGSPTSLMPHRSFDPPSPSTVKSFNGGTLLSAVKHIFVFFLSPRRSHPRDRPDCRFSSKPPCMVETKPSRALG